MKPSAKKSGKSAKRQQDCEFHAVIESGNLGAYLQLARERVGLSQNDVAEKLGMHHFQSVSQWERNASGSVPIPALRKLVEIYDLPMFEVYEVLLKFQTVRLEKKLEQKFFGGARKGGRTA